jgi:hypothetical protein
MIFILSCIYYALWKQHSSYRDEPNGVVIERFRAEPGQRVQKDTISIQIVAQMDELFGIDGQARQEGLSQIEHHVLRLGKSKPLLEQIKAAIQAARTGQHRPSTDLHPPRSPCSSGLDRHQNGWLPQPDGIRSP